MLSLNVRTPVHENNHTSHRVQDPSLIRISQHQDPRNETSESEVSFSRFDLGGIILNVDILRIFSLYVSHVSYQQLWDFRLKVPREEHRLSQLSVYSITHNLRFSSINIPAICVRFVDGSLTKHSTCVISSSSSSHR